VDGAALSAARPIEVDDTRVGEGYGMPTDASREAAELFAKTEGIFVDHTYTAKAAAGMLAGIRGGAFADARSVLFWHTGGQVGLFA
jgi:L-cysteate sulfo-lyase